MLSARKLWNRLCVYCKHRSLTGVGMTDEVALRIMQDSQEAVTEGTDEKEG